MSPLYPTDVLKKRCFKIIIETSFFKTSVDKQCAWLCHSGQSRGSQGKKNIDNPIRLKHIYTCIHT